MAKIHYYREGKLVVEEEKEEEYSEYKLDIIYLESFKTFFATIEALTTESSWIPKKVISKEQRIKKWYQYLNMNFFYHLTSSRAKSVRQ